MRSCEVAIIWPDIYIYLYIPNKYPLYKVYIWGWLLWVASQGRHQQQKLIVLFWPFGRWYCWWLKSCTTKDDDYPIIYRVLTIPGGAGFQPSTVSFVVPPQQKKQVGDAKNHATRLPVWLLLYLNRNTHQKTNIVTENRSSQKEFHLPTIHFQGQFVSFREANFGETIILYHLERIDG